VISIVLSGKAPCKNSTFTGVFSERFFSFKNSFLRMTPGTIWNPLR
jgi:hypothetical protein